MVGAVDGAGGTDGVGCDGVDATDDDVDGVDGNEGGSSRGTDGVGVDSADGEDTGGVDAADDGAGCTSTVDAVGSADGGVDDGGVDGVDDGVAVFVDSSGSRVADDVGDTVGNVDDGVVADGLFSGVSITDGSDGDGDGSDDGGDGDGDEVMCSSSRRCRFRSLSSSIDHCAKNSFHIRLRCSTSAMYHLIITKFVEKRHHRSSNSMYLNSDVNKSGSSGFTFPRRCLAAASLSCSLSLCSFVMSSSFGLFPCCTCFNPALLIAWSFESINKKSPRTNQRNGFQQYEEVFYAYRRDYLENVI